MQMLNNDDLEDTKSSLRAIFVSCVLLVLAIVIAYFFLHISSLSLVTIKMIDIPVPPGKSHTQGRALDHRDLSPSQGASAYEGKEAKITIHREEVLTELHKNEEIVEVVEEEPQEIYIPGPGLTATKGVIQGPSGKETYYNLDMTAVISTMRAKGFDSETYPYWIRGDGVKMLGNYVMVAANLNTRSKGTILETSLGTGIVCDTGGFAETDAAQIDIATNW